jgi:hypothetical protein
MNVRVFTPHGSISMFVARAALVLLGGAFGFHLLDLLLRKLLPNGRPHFICQGSAFA